MSTKQSENQPSSSPKTRARRPPLHNPERVAWTIEETAIAVGVTPLLVKRALKSGQLKGCRLGRQTLRILPEEALSWLRRSIDSSNTSSST